MSCTAQWTPLLDELDFKYPNDSARSKFLLTDHQGVVWIGTNQGLVKLTGRNLDQAISLSGPISSAVAVDSTIWTGSESGKIQIFNASNNKTLSSFTLADSSAISGIYSYKDTVLVSTLGEGLFLISKNDTLHFNTQNALSDNYIYDAALLNGKLVCASDRGIDLVNLKNKDQTRHFETSITTSISVSDTLILAGSHRFGAVSINLKNTLNNTFSRNGENHNVQKFKYGLDRTFALTHQGIFEYKPDNVTEIQPILEKSGILDFVILREGVMLVLNEDQRIDIVDLRFSTISNNDESNYTAIIASKNKLYAAGSKGIYSIDITTGKDKQLLIPDNNLVVVSLAVTPKELYIGTFNRGLLIYNFQTEELDQLDKSNGLPDNNVLSMAFLSDTLWFATLSGISALTPNKAIIQVPNGDRMQSTYIYSVFAEQESLLIGTDGLGLFNFKNNTFHKVSYADSLREETIYHISKGGNGNLWFTTKNFGLVEYDKQNETLLKKFDAPNVDAMAIGGPSNSAIAVGKGWIKLFYGEQSLSLANQKTLSEVSGEYLNNITYSGGNTVYFASHGDIYSYVPQNKFVPPGVYLESIQTNLQKAVFSQSELNAEINHIVYSFGAIWYQGLDNVKFRYRLKGLDEDWNETMGNTAVYPNLKAGSYTFEIEAGLGDVYYPQSLRIHKFSILKPIYLRLWFIILSLILIAVLIYLIFRWQVARTNKHYASEKKRIESELDVLRNQVNPHFLFNSLNTLMNLIETEPKEAEEYLQRLSDFYRKILVNKEDHIVTVESELKNLEEYIYLQKKRFGDALNLKVTLNIASLRSKIPALTFQLLAENAIKHNVVSQTRPLKIEITDSKNHILFTNLKAPLKNKAEGTGLGIENIKSRYVILFNLKVQITNSETEFTVNLPIAT